MYRNQTCCVGCTALVVVLGALLAFAQNDPKGGDYEKQIKESEVPKAALDTLKKLAGGAPFTEFAEEVEHGQKYYEGSWKTADGNVDGLVTETGDVVEIEESIPAAKVPNGAKTAIEKTAGKDTTVHFERKTVYLFEAHFKSDGKGREIIVTADGREFHEDCGKEGQKEDGDDDDEEK